MTDPHNETDKVRRLMHAVFGNGHDGLVQRQDRVEGHMFTNQRTGEPGLVRKVKDHDEVLIGIRAQMRALSWLLGLFGTGAILWFFRWVFGPIG